MKVFSLSLLLFIGSLATLRAQENVPFNQVAEIQFKQALTNFEQHNYLVAATMFAQVEKDFPLHQRTTAAIIMRAKSLFHIEQYQASIGEISEFMTRFPESMYINDARFTLAQDLYVLRHYGDAIPELMTVIENSADTVLVRRAETLLSTTGVYHTPIDQIEYLYTDAKTERGIIAVGRVLGQKLAREGEFTKAIGMLRELIARYPTDPERPSLDSLASLFAKGTRIKIGLLLPLLAGVSQAPGHEIASDILAGAKYAVEQFNSTSTLRIAVDVRDTQRDQARITEEVDSLTADPEVVAVIGPVFSDEVEMAAHVAARHGLPLVTPTATANGLTAPGREIFQANPDYTIRGELAAQFAVKNLGLTHLAVLNSAEAFSTAMAQAFIREAKRLGAHVVVHQNYARGVGDLQQQMDTLRKASLLLQHQPTIDFSSEMKKADIQKFVRAGVSHTLLDSLIDRNAHVSAGEVLGPEWSELIDSLHLPVVRPVLDSIGVQYPATGLQGLYAPIASPDEIGVIGAQLAYYNIKTQLLGSGDWFRLDELDANNRYVNGVYFDTDCYLTNDDPAYARFRGEFQKETGKEPSKNVVLGYDIMKLILSLTHGKSLRRDELCQRLADVRDYVSLHSVISFTPNRVNGALTVLQYKDGRITEIAHELWRGDEAHGTTTE